MLTACLLSDANDFLLTMLLWFADLEYNRRLTSFLIKEIAGIKRSIAFADGQGELVFGDYELEDEPSRSGTHLKVIEGGKGAASPLESVAENLHFEESVERKV